MQKLEATWDKIYEEKSVKVAAQRETEKADNEPQSIMQTAAAKTAPREAPSDRDASVPPAAPSTQGGSLAPDASKVADKTKVQSSATKDKDGKIE